MSYYYDIRRLITFIIYLIIEFAELNPIDLDFPPFCVPNRKDFTKQNTPTTGRYEFSCYVRIEGYDQKLLSQKCRKQSCMHDYYH
jgi:hypothetical protein